jgi:endonuclease/exonuclease/phosphatase (EEP) superfamily protein YafD
MNPAGMRLVGSVRAMAKSSPSGNTHHMKTILVLLLGVLLAAACATVPPGVSNRTLRVGTPDAVASACHPVAPDHVVSSTDGSRTEFLDPSEINLLIWNTHKGQDNGWLEEFAELSADQDLLLLQEAFLKDELRDLLLRETLSWNLATTFMKDRIETGVMTASHVTPASACVQRTMEPLLSLPKSTLISRFRIEGSADTLLVGNIHAVNFTMGTEAFRSQLDRLASILDEHDGPAIVAGDFNDWSHSRSEILDETLVETGLLRKVTFDGKGPRTVLGRTVDHVYYRGLTVVAGRVLESDTSDHNPIWVQFERSEEHAL